MNDAEKQFSMNDMLFVALVRDFESMAMVGFGKLVDPVTQKADRNLDRAKIAIDMLGMLDDKTRGNLDDNQSSLMRQVLTNLRLNYVDELEKEKAEHKDEAEPKEEAEQKPEAELKEEGDVKESKPKEEGKAGTEDPIDSGEGSGTLSGEDASAAKSPRTGAAKDTAAEPPVAKAAEGGAEGGTAGSAEGSKKKEKPSGRGRKGAPKGSHPPKEKVSDAG